MVGVSEPLLSLRLLKAIGRYVHCISSSSVAHVERGFTVIDLGLPDEDVVTCHSIVYDR